MGIGTLGLVCSASGTRFRTRRQMFSCYPTTCSCNTRLGCGADRQLRSPLRDVSKIAGLMAEQGELGGETTTWLQLVTRRVIAAFLEKLAVSHGWRKLYLVTPWISDFGIDCGLSFPQLLKGLKDYGATAYVVTRPPVREHEWHRD